MAGSLGSTQAASVLDYDPRHEAGEKGQETTRAPETNHDPIATVSRNEAEDVARALTDVSQALDRSLQFSVDDQTGRIVIRVTDESGEVIREVPPEEAVKTARQLGSLVGLLVDEER